MNIIVCGGTGSGKTTILNILSSFIGENERVITIEDAAELRLHQNHVIPLETRDTNYDAKGEIVILDEFTSVVNRAAAKSMSFALQRYARQKDLKIVIASCHFDIIEWLNPNYIFNLNHKDENGNVELEKMVYSDDAEYKNQQYVKETEVLSEPRVIN